MRRSTLALLLAVSPITAAQARELTSAYVVTAAANKAGVAGTDWHTDLTIYNPQRHDLPVVMHFLPTGRDNGGAVPTVTFDVLAWETLNLWNVLGPDGFDVRGETGALLVYADTEAITCAEGSTDCDFAVFARTYTLDPAGGSGEYGQAVPGFPGALGLDASVIAYLPQLTDGADFRTNLGVASWTDAFVTVRVELQDAAGAVLDRRDHMVPPYGHIQWRLERGVEGGTAAVYVTRGPAGAMVYPYASVVNNATGDAVNVEAHLTAAGLAAATGPQAQATGVRARAAAVGARAAGAAGLARPARLPVPAFSLDRLRRR